MKMFFLTFFFISLLASYALSNGDKMKTDNSLVQNHYQMINDFVKQSKSDFFDVEFTPRKVKALIFSSIVPGSGQTYLGSNLKGMGISLAFYGTALTAVIAHNNAQGREDRIKVLTQEYATKGNYSDAEEVWQTLLSEKENRDNDYTRRSIFTWCAVGVWLYNIVDVIFLTEEQSESDFAGDSSIIDMNVVYSNNFQGFALKLNLP
ncbi:MAG: hypothetical protein HXY50_00445 [Ignavibacteriaceae bacterium]|nr:hypothetical protein [Ignavibacteriaceae bacterium]